VTRRSAVAVKKTAYLIAGGYLKHPLLRRQVVELLGEIKKIGQSTNITVVFFYTIPHLLSCRADLEVTRQCLSELVGCAGVTVVSPQYNDIEAYLSPADVGMMFLHKAKLFLSTKVVEYVAASLAVVLNRNCEGAASLVREHPEIGRIVDLGLGDLDMQHEFSEATVDRILDLRNAASLVEEFAHANIGNFTVATQHAAQYSRMNTLFNGSRVHSGARL
jgi:hypothetical protein